MEESGQPQPGQDGELASAEAGYAEVAEDGWAYDADGNPYDPVTGEYYDEATYQAGYAYGGHEGTGAGAHPETEAYVPGASEGEAVVTDQTALHYAAYEGNEEALANYLAPSEVYPAALLLPPSPPNPPRRRALFAHSAIQF